MKTARAKRAKILFFIVKYANLWGFCRCLRRGCLSSHMYLSRPGRDKRNEKVDNTRKRRGLEGLQDDPVIHLAWYKLELEQLFTIVSMTAVDFDLLIIKYSFVDST